MINVNTVKRYCRNFTKIENYEEAVNSPEKWECHHRLESTPFSGKSVSIKFLIEQGLYFDQPPEALIFLSTKVHRNLHAENRSKETLLKMNHAGTKWFNNGKVSIRALKCPEGFVPGRLKRGN